MIITGIEPFPRGKGRVSVYVDGEFAFALYKGELSAYKVEIGTTLDDDTYNLMLREVLIPRAKKRAMNLLQKMDRTEADVRNKLFDSGYPTEAVDEAIDYLKSFRYIDDRRYASDYFHYKITSKSFKQIRNELSAKGISREIIDDVETEYNNTEVSAEHELIIKLIAKRMRNITVAPSYEEKQKLFAYLYNKGFTIADIERAYSDYISEMELAYEY